MCRSPVRSTVSSPVLLIVDPVEGMRGLKPWVRVGVRVEWSATVLKLGWGHLGRDEAVAARDSTPLPWGEPLASI